MAPTWLDPESEQPRTKIQLTKQEFVLASIRKLLSIGCNFPQAIGVTANAVLESGWGQSLYNNNPFGWKITSTHAKNHKKKTGRSAKWFRAKGHVKSGDSPEVYYRVFDDYIQAYEAWLENFVPKNSEPSYRYHKTGNLFWSGGDWFPEMIQAGYKGVVTKANPSPSIKAHRDIEAKITAMWIQDRLGLEVDGKVGPKTRRAIEDFCVRHNIANKEISPELIQALMNA